MRCVDQLPQCLGERFRLLARSRDDENGIVAAIAVRQGNRALPAGFGKLRLFYVADYADNREQLCVVRFIGMGNALTERATVWPIEAGKVFVHDTNALGAMGIV